MTIETDIIAVLEERRPRMPIDIAAALSHHNRGSVLAVCSTMAKRGALVKVGAKLDLPPADSPPVDPTPWKADGLAPFQRVKLFLESRGASKRHALLLMLNSCGVEAGKNVLADMIRDGDIHSTGDRYCLGPSPRAMPPRTQGHAWNNGIPARAAPKKPDTPSEAQRTPEATGTSKKPEAAAAPTPVADEHDEGAQTLESPPSAIGPAGASEDFTVVRNRVELEEALGLPPSSLLDAHTLLEAPADPPRGARVLVEGVDLSIEISGSRDAVLRVLRTVNLGELFQ